MGHPATRHSSLVEWVTLSDVWYSAASECSRSAAALIRSKSRVRLPASSVTLTKTHKHGILTNIFCQRRSTFPTGGDILEDGLISSLSNLLPTGGAFHQPARFSEALATFQRAYTNTALTAAAPPLVQRRRKSNHLCARQRWPPAPRNLDSRITLCSMSILRRAHGNRPG
jgi:hypothetical protein